MICVFDLRCPVINEKLIPEGGYHWVMLFFLSVQEHKGKRDFPLDLRKKGHFDYYTWTVHQGITFLVFNIKIKLLQNS